LFGRAVRRHLCSALRFSFPCSAENLDEMGIFVSLAGTGKTYTFSNSVLLHLVYAMLTYKQKIDLHSTVAGL
jgi:hypothetical protein